MMLQIRPAVLSLLSLLLLNGCATQTAEWSPPKGTTRHAELFARYGEIQETYYMSYSADHEGIIIRKSVPTGSGDLRSHVKVVAEQRIPCSPWNAWAFNLTVAGLDLHGHAESLKRRKDYADGPYYTLYIDGKVEAQGWTPEFDELYIHVLNTIVMRQFENATK
jgi:hypothetical protein